jgi:serine/threonine protein kinase
LYTITYKKLYTELRKSTSFLRKLVLEIAQALDLLAQNKIVHSDLKTENILVKSEDGEFRFKLIDYGSSFQFESLKQYKLATPEYMCPELLNFILYENRKEHHPDMLDYVKEYTYSSGIDVWGLGCIVLELIHGLPLWLANPTKIQVQGREEIRKGLFAVSDRSFSKILQRQLYTVKNLESFLSKNVPLPHSEQQRDHAGRMHQRGAPGDAGPEPGPAHAALPNHKPPAPPLIYQYFSNHHDGLSSSSSRFTFWYSSSVRAQRGAS